MTPDPETLNYRSPHSLAPVPKVAAAGGIGVPTAVLVAWLLGMFGVEMPAEVQAALGALIATFWGYMKP